MRDLEMLVRIELSVFDFKGLFDFAGAMVDIPNLLNFFAYVTKLSVRSVWKTLEVADH